MKREDVAHYLEELAKGLKTGRLNLEYGDDTVLLEPTALITLELDATAKKEKSKLALKFSWAIEETSLPEPSLKISSKQLAASATAAKKAEMAAK